jgi:hypothetical protein
MGIGNQSNSEVEFLLYLIDKYCSYPSVKFNGNDNNNQKSKDYLISLQQKNKVLAYSDDEVKYLDYLVKKYT